ncbi:adenylyltransferase/cytidyltransferase family protein [Candidatus Dojkabacteria bacterium]|nr:adenylyltransferase/cytidyltransferase family protein [Candidatus Dojkabacteria bacterium]
MKTIIESAKRSGKSVLIKKGVFDIIHPGHIYAINMFKEVANVVIILTQSDEFTRKKKGNDRPINSQKQRVEVVDGLKGVDYTFADKSNSREEYIKLLEYLKPTIVAVTSVNPEKTRDYTSPFWKLVEFPDKKKPGYSSTEIIDKIKYFNG